MSVHDESGTRRGSGVCVRRVASRDPHERSARRQRRRTINVTTSDGVVHAARVVGRDATTDLVLLRGSDSGRRCRRAVGAARRRVAREAGDTVWVVGAPSPGRHVAVDEQRRASRRPTASSRSRTGPTTSGLLETGAASSAASSGGALVDAAGNVTGIVLSPVGDSRMTYAVPIDDRARDRRRPARRRATPRTARSASTASTRPPARRSRASSPTDRPKLAGVRVGDVVESRRQARGRLDRTTSWRSSGTTARASRSCSSCAAGRGKLDGAARRSRAWSRRSAGRTPAAANRPAMRRACATGIGSTSSPAP